MSSSGILDLASVEHELLGVANVDARLLHLEEERQLHDVDPDGLIEHAVIAQYRHDVLDRGFEQSRFRRDRATQPEHARSAVFGLEPRREELMVTSR